MAIDEQKFKQLKRQADDARAARDRAKGQLEAAEERLNVEFGCACFDEAEELLDKLMSDAVLADAAYNEAAADFEKEWDERINQNI